MTVEVHLDVRSPHVWSDDESELDGVLKMLKDIHGLKKHSIIMKDLERGGFLFFLYQSIESEWISELV